MKGARCLLLLAAFAASASGQNLLMKDGTIVPTKGLRRDGDSILATVEIPGTQPGEAAKTGELGYPIEKITRIDFPEPPLLRTVPEVIAQGKGAEALTQLEPWVRYYEGFRDAPGSWWRPIAMLKIEALDSLGREDEADALAQKIAQLATDPETARAAQVQLASSLARKGEQPKALEICEAALKESKEPGTLAMAAVTKGQCLLDANQGEEALLAFLQVPVLYPEQKGLLPEAMLGSGRAHFAMDDFAGARTALNELTDTYPGSRAAAQVKTELDKVARREKALAPPK